MQPQHAPNDGGFLRAILSNSLRTVGNIVNVALLFTELLHTNMIDAFTTPAHSKSSKLNYRIALSYHDTYHQYATSFYNTISSATIYSNTTQHGRVL